MRRDEIVGLINSLELPINEYYILSGASLVIRNIREECGDLDLCISNEAFEILKSKFEVQHKRDNWYSINNNIEFVVEPKGNFKMEFEAGFPLEDINEIYRYKKERNSEQDKKDIIGIEKYIAETKYEKCCGAIVINGDKILLVKQEDGAVSLPKGHVEGEETEIETAIREVLEETGVSIEILSEERHLTIYKPKINVQKGVVFFLAKKVGGEEKAQKGEIADIKWVTLEKAIGEVTYDNIKAILLRAKKEIEEIISKQEKEKKEIETR